MNWASEFLPEAAGRVVAIYGFHPGCPACVNDALPQAQRVWALFRAEDVLVVAVQLEGSGFDGSAYGFVIHHDAGMARAFGWQATPALTLIDKRGRVRRASAGVLPDLQLGAELMSLLREPA